MHLIFRVNGSSKKIVFFKFGVSFDFLCTGYGLGDSVFTQKRLSPQKFAFFWIWVRRSPQVFTLSFLVIIPYILILLGFWLPPRSAGGDSHGSVGSREAAPAATKERRWSKPQKYQNFYLWYAPDSWRHRRLTDSRSCFIRG